MKKITSIHWVMALFIAAISLCSVLPGQHVRASEYSPIGEGGLFAAAEENDPYSCLQSPPPGLISATSGEPEVRFLYDDEESIYYRCVYEGNESSIYSHYEVAGTPSSAFKVRVQLKDQTQASDVRFETDNNNSLTLTDGGFWFPDEEIRQYDERSIISFEIYSSKAVEVDYTVSLYQSEDLTTKPMASIEKKVIFVAEEDFPVLPSLPRLRGELNTDVPCTFSIEPGFLQGKAAILRLSFDNVDLDSLVVSGEGWRQTEYWNRYEYRIDHLTQDEITVNFTATGQIGGRYRMSLYDGEGNLVVEEQNIGELRFPANLSEDDQQALKALMEDNPESTELRNFIETGLYKKDIDRYGTTEKVAVMWNDEASARVSDFYLSDEDRKVSTLNLNALKGLETVNLDGTNLKTLDLSGLILGDLSLINTPLKWSDVKLPKWNDEYHSLSGYTMIQLNPSVKKGAEIDLSEFAHVDGIASTFSWFEYNRSEGPKPVELKQTSPGKFILDGEIGQRFYCEIKNERYENWIMQTSNLICTTSGEPMVRFEYEPSPIGYQPVYKNHESSFRSSYAVESIPPSAFKVRVQLKDQTQANDVRFVTDNNNRMTLTDGGFWFPAEEITQKNEYFYFDFNILSSKAVEVDYTVSLYRSEDLTTKPLASSERKALFVAEEDYPVLPLLPSLRGELNTDVPYTFSIKPGFLQGKPAIVRLSFHDVDLDNLLVSGKGWQKNEYFNRYEYRIDCLTQDEITVNFKATRPIGGRYEMDLYDGEGNSVMGTGNAVLQIPANLSDDDQQALRAIQEANPESKELRDFIETGLYKKDINLNETTEKVAVKWNEEAPARVIHFLLRDDDRKVTTLNLNALNRLKTVELRGTNLKTLDLSGLTPVNLGLHDTPLKWSDVKLPNWTDEHHSLYGYTTIPLDNPSVKKGEEIDLSEFAQEGTSTFTWFEWNRSGAPKPVELTQTSPGKFILDGENGQRFYCEIQNERYGNWILRTSNLICSASGEPVVQFKYEPNPTRYQPVYNGGKSSVGSKFMVESIPPSSFKVRVQLKDQAQASDVRFETYNNKNLPLTDGGFWFPAEEINQEKEYFYINFRIASSKAVEVDYTVSLYQSEDLTIEPMASTEKKVIFVAGEDYPVLPSLPSLRGELETDVPYTFSIEPGFLQGQPAIVRLHFENVDLNNLVVSGEGWQKTEYWNSYEYRIDRLTQDKITVNFKASGQIGGWYLMDLCDGKGNSVMGTRNAVLQIPTNLSNEDQQALRAMQEANPESKELRDFIVTGRYKKDIDIYNTTEQVAVTWNYETPSRVSDFLLRDDYRKVSTLNLNALKGLETVTLQGTNLKTLDLSNLTLSRLTLLDTPLKWGDVKLPKWTEYNSRLDGNTRIELDPTIMKGAEIDLSEFAHVDGTASTFSWFEYKKSEAPKPVKLASPSAGKFILNGENGQEFYCNIKNERYGNWFLVTTLVTIDAPVIHFSQQDVMALERLVKDANDPKLNEWWESKAWQGSGMINGAQTEWNDENPRRLKSLWILYAGLSETVDLSTLDRLETLSLMGNNDSKLTKLILPTEKASLSLLNVAGNKKLTSLDVTSYANLNHLDASGTGLEACDVSKNTKLEVLYMQKTKIPGLEATAPEIAKQLEAYGVPNGNETIDLDLFPALKKMIPNKRMRYSDVKHPRQMEPLDFDLVKLISLPGDAYDPNYSSYGHTIDVSDSIKQEGVTAGPIWAVYNPFTYETDTLSHTGMTYTIGNGLKPDEAIYAEVHNDLFPGWTLRYITIVYTMDGDVNLDRTVDVKDVTSLISSMLGKWPSDRIFGWIQANTNHDEYYGDAADLVGLVNIILGKPVTKGEALRAAYIPQAELSVDERNNLYIDHEAPISAIYLEFAGATKELALTGDAARMTQSRSLQNDTLRIVAYSMDGKSIAAGKQALMQLAPGMQLTKASFSDAKAVPLKLVGDYLPTANETIAPFDEVKAVYNYPNPASGTTTFCYSLSEDANSVEIELIASNGAVVARLQGLPTAQGRHEENVSLPFGNGVYFYRLVLNGKQIVATNTLIIK